LNGGKVAHYEEEPMPDWLKDDEDQPVSYPDGVLDKMSMKQLKQERTKQIGRSENAALDDPAYDDAGRKLTALLFEIDKRQCEGRNR
jgi:hypothetical protein